MTGDVYESEGREYVRGAAVNDTVGHLHVGIADSVKTRTLCAAQAVLTLFTAVTAECR